MQLIKTGVFKPFLSDVKVPDYAGVGCKGDGMRYKRHDFAMLILKARHEIGQIQAEECFS